jgi:hypothetical protein
VISARELEPDLRKPFSIELWLGLLQQLLPSISLFSASREIPLNTKTERATATSLQQIGFARLADARGVGLFVVEANPKVDLTRNRVGLRQLSARWIDQVDIHAALTLSYQPGIPYYRLTYSARETVFTPDLQTVTRDTATRRFTFLLGEGERRRTAAQRLAMLAERRPELTIHDLIIAFSVEKLNKEFFSDFCRARGALSEEIQSRNSLGESDSRAEAQTLLNRLLFLYFIQRKGWLHRDPNYLAAYFQRFDDSAPENTTFYSKFLVPLFEIVSTEWKLRDKVTRHLNEDDPRTHDLPFLNGGLFADELGNEQEEVRRRRRLRIGNSVFHHVFADLLERYNFTIHEDSERDAEVAVDPEMLGRIFEELVLTGEESESGGKSRRHDTGSHYTPRPIVRYLCREGLAGWLEQFPPFSNKPEPRKIVDQLLSIDASTGIDEESWENLHDAVTPTEAGNALDTLLELRACDPAVGSGAFPVGLLHELLNVARLLDGRARGKDPAEADSDWLYDNKKRLIERCLYGVDIQAEALEICKLRLWLSLMVDHELGVDPTRCDRRSFAAALRKVEPLPNLEFKIRRANALIDMIRGQRLHIDAPAEGPHTRRILSELTDAKHDFYSATTTKEKLRLRFAIYRATADLAQNELSWVKRHHAGLGLEDDAENRARLLEIQNAEHALGKVLHELARAKKLRSAADQQDALERLHEWWDDPKAPTFVWFFDFAEVFYRAKSRPVRDQLIDHEDGACRSPR